MFLSTITGMCLAVQPPGLEPLWQTGGFDNPESVIADGRGGYFVSNVDGEGAQANGRGYLSRIDGSGAVVAPQRWSTGLDAPKGLAVSGGRLFVTDIDRLVAIDPDSGRILEHFPVGGARFLNDAAAHDGRIFISDSGTGRIYVLEDRQVSLWLEDPALAGINGLLAEPGRLLVTTMERGDVIAIDWHSRRLEVLVGGLPDADGIAPTPDGGYVISQWPGDVWYWRDGGEAWPVMQRQDPPVLMNDLTIVDETLVIPHWEPGSVSAWRLTCGESGPLTGK